MIGVVVASASGGAVALSVTLGGISVLVGVAISASLLPPFVNSGMLFAYSIFGIYVHADINSRLMAQVVSFLSVSVPLLVFINR